MWPWLILFVQTTPPAPPKRIDLLAPFGTASCKPEPGDEVVVCGGRDNPYRLRPLPPIATDPTIPKAEIGIGNAKAAIETEQGNVGGIPTNRAMFRLKMPF